MQNTLTLDGRQYVAVDTLTDGEAPDTEDGGVRIVILQRGFVFVGHYHRTGDQFRIENAANVRRWGAKAGLGELAEKGPMIETILDVSCTVRGHVLTIIATIDCDQERWHDRV